MKERHEIINLNKANLFSLILMAAAAVVGAAYYIAVSVALGKGLGFGSLTAQFSLVGKSILLLVGIAGGTVLHELVHGITWALFCKNGWKSISFGVLWKTLTPYCHCSETLKKNHYITGALTPLFAVGLLPLLISPFAGSVLLFFLGVIFVSGASGDLMIVWRMRKENPDNTIMDHPTEPGYIVYENEQTER